MITSKEYISFFDAAYEVMPKLAGKVKEEYFFTNIDWIRKEYKTLNSEFQNYQMYPRYEMIKFHESVEIIKELCSKTEVTIVIPIPDDTKLEEKNWSQFRKVENIARFWYEGVEITKIIDI